MVIGGDGLVIIMAIFLWEERGEEGKIRDGFEVRKRRSWCLQVLMMVVVKMIV